MKNILLILALLAFVGCDENAPTKNEVKESPDKKYTLEELESDPNWVEITDIDTIKSPCIDWELYEMGKLFRDKESIKKLVLLYDTTSIFYKNDLCEKNIDLYNINYNIKDVILFNCGIGGGGPITIRRIFKNDKYKVIYYYLSVEPTSGTFEYIVYGDAIVIDKLPADYIFVSDTVFINRRVKTE